MKEYRNSDGQISNELFEHPFTWLTKHMLIVGSIAYNYGQSTNLSSKITCAQINAVGNFDTFVLDQYKQLKKADINFINKTLDGAKKRVGSYNSRKVTLGFKVEEYENIVHKYDIIMEKSAPIFIPTSLAELLIRIDESRSISNYFEEAINIEKQKVKR